MGTHKFAIDGQDFEVEVGSRRGTTVQVTVNGKAFDVELQSAAAAAGLRSAPPPASPTASAPIAAPPPVAAPAAAAGGTAGDGAVRAPMAGLVLSVKVQVGAQVAVGDELLVLEAMKMENAITAFAAGTVKAVAVQAQQTVNQGDLLVDIG